VTGRPPPAGAAQRTGGSQPRAGDTRARTAAGARAAQAPIGTARAADAGAGHAAIVRPLLAAAVLAIAVLALWVTPGAAARAGSHWPAHPPGRTLPRPQAAIALDAVRAAPAGIAAGRRALSSASGQRARPAGARPSGGQPGTGQARHRFRWSGGLAIMAGSVFAAFLAGGLTMLSAVGRDDRSRRLPEQLGRYALAPPPEPENRSGRIGRAALGGVTRLLASGPSEQRLARRLEIAAISRTPAEWVLLGGCCCPVLAAVLTLLTGSAVAAVLIAAVAVWLGMRLLVSVRISRRRAAFGEQLPDVLQLVASSLQSGFSLPQALDAVVREDREPAAGEFSRALAETRIGVGVEAALEQVADRMQSVDLRWTVMAIAIQRAVGGNLAEVLRNTVGTMRERGQLRRQVRALSAEGRLSAYILIALPVLVGCWLFLTRRSYLHPLYSSTPGLVMLGGAAVMVLLGSLWMRKVVKVEV
jgi:Flp pilus assembly protein TadB